VCIIFLFYRQEKHFEMLRFIAVYAKTDY